MKVLNHIGSSLYDIEYKLLPYNPKSKIGVKDEIKLHKDEAPNKVQFIFTREVVFSPESNFKAKISFLLDCKIKEDKNFIEFEWDKFLEEQEEDDILDLAGNALSRTSLLLSQITSSDGDRPFITAPIPYIKFPKKKK